MREWNPMWSDIGTGHTTTMRRMVVASINWVEQWPSGYPEWKVLPLACSDDWAMIYQPTNDCARQWFDAIVADCEKRPSPVMMGHAITCGTMLRSLGWDRFNQFMLHG